MLLCKTLTRFWHHLLCETVLQMFIFKLWASTDPSLAGCCALFSVSSVFIAPSQHRNVYRLPFPIQMFTEMLLSVEKATHSGLAWMMGTLVRGSS